MSFIHRLGLPFWSIVIAIVLWAQVHGQGMGSVRLDVALQVRDVPEDMVIVNDLPDQVSITVSGLQALLNSLDTQALFVSVDASSLNMPGVIEQALDIETIDLPAGLKVERIQPDSVQLQVDHIVKRTIEVQPIFDLPQGWKAEHVLITPSVITLSGPEVWLSTMDKVKTSALRLKLNQGPFDVQTTIVPLSGQGIHTLGKDVKIHVRGNLVWTRTVQNSQQPLHKKVLLTPERNSIMEDGASIVPIPEGGHGELIEQPVLLEPKEEAVKTSIVPVPVQLQVEDVVEQSLQVQPIQAQPIQAQPIQAQPIQAQPIQAQPIQAQPVQDELIESVVKTSIVPMPEDVYTDTEAEPKQQEAIVAPDRQIEKAKEIKGN